MNFTHALLLPLMAASFASSAHATIYLVAKDHYSPAVAVAAISSGPLVSGSAVTGRPGVGFTGWSGAVFDIDRRVDTEVFRMMGRAASATEIQSYVLGRIEGKYSRYVFASSGGTIDYVFPRSGCGTPECGVEMDPSGEFLSMGGGLQPDVVPRAMAIYSRVHGNAQIPFACRMTLGLRAIVSVGGEIEKFNSAVLGIETAGAASQAIYKIQNNSLPEESLIGKVEEQLARAGLTCPTPAAAGLELGTNVLPKLPRRAGDPSIR